MVGIEYLQTKSHVYIGHTYIGTTIATTFANNNIMGIINALAFSSKTNQASSFITVAYLH